MTPPDATTARAAAAPARSVPVFEGVWPILATPFDADDRLDLASLDRLVRFMAALGVDGVTVTGVLGESNRLLDRERVDIVRTAVAAAGDRPVIVGTSHSGTLAARALSQEAQALGAAAVMLTPHAEATPNDARVFEYFRTVADGLSIAVVAQDHPASSGVHMPVPLLAKLVAEVPQVACIKLEAVPTAPKLRALVAAFGTVRHVPILTGLGALYGLFDLRAGASGFNTGFAFPEVLMAMRAHAVAGRWAQVEALYTRFLPLIVFEQQPGPAIRKVLLARRGLLDHARVRHPSAQVDAAVEAELDRLLTLCLPGVDVTRPIAV